MGKGHLLNGAVPGKAVPLIEPAGPFILLQNK